VRGMHSQHTIYDDTNIPQLRSIPDSAIHRNVDLTVLAADAQGFVRTYIIFPSVIYGLATGPIFDTKLANAHSMVVPLLVKMSMDCGCSGMIGEGRNVWPHVHVHDVAELYMVLLHQILLDPERPGHGWNGFYFAENGTFTFLELAQAIGNALAQLEQVTNANPTSYTQEEVGKYFGGVGGCFT
jgi:nucleoside-diphosphate-sugar epimerase